MSVVWITRTLLTTSAMVTGIAAIDAALGRNWDLVTITGLALVLQVVALAGRGRRDSRVGLRPDLIRWLHERAAVTGESVETIAGNIYVMVRPVASSARRWGSPGFCRINSRNDRCC